MIFTVFSVILSAVSGQLGPNYDPIFYDVMIYIFGTVMFSVFLFVVIISLIIRRKRNKKQYFKSRNNFSDDSDKKNWD